jgi:hypothetical protein
MQVIAVVLNLYPSGLIHFPYLFPSQVRVFAAFVFNGHFGAVIAKLTGHG